MDQSPSEKIENINSRPVTAKNTSALPPQTHDHRWWFPLAVLIVAPVLQTLLRWGKHDSTGMVFVILYIWPAALFSIFLWSMFFARFALRTRVVIVGSLVGLGAVFAGAIASGVVRVEATGAMTPVVKFFPKPIDHRAASEYFKTQAASSDRNTMDKVSLLVDEADFPDFRGAKRDGVIRGIELDVDWAKTGLAPVWKHPIGIGWSAVSVVDDFLWTMDQIDEDERTVCLRASTGDLVWQHRDKARFREPIGGDGPRATPVFHNGFVYSQGATGILNCLDAVTGERKWSRNILADAGAEGTPVPNIEWAISATPLIDTDRVIVHGGGGHQRALLAYSTETGEILWSASNRPASYASIVKVSVCDVPQYLIFHGTGCSGHAVDDGKELWWHPFETTPKVNSIIPLVFDGHRVFISASYGMGSQMFDVAQKDGQWTTKELWSNRRVQFKFNDPVVIDGTIYGLDEGILTGMDPTNGKTLWRKGRYGFGQLLAVGSTLLIATEQGELAVVDVSRNAAKEIARVPIIEGKTWNNLAIANGRLYIRNGAEIACLQISKSTTDSTQLTEAPPVNSESAKSVP